MGLKLAVLHAHHSNIAYTEMALEDREIEQIHHVDPGLIHAIKTKSKDEVHQRVLAQLEWLTNTNPASILITCTNYSLYIKEHEISGIPILKLDELFFDTLLPYSEMTLYFTNSETVEGTMNRLQDFHSGANYHVKLIDDAFHHLMNNKKERYTKAIIDYIGYHPANGQAVFPQLSMYQAATYLNKGGQSIVTPVHALKKLSLSH
ncbi:hypothetical protein SH601_10705 [Gracilibacillus sp. S3-1-1]|uniref:Uncharacterized protein n=1 Tax=Gracilibacillus pellucidus TaxID=3095368 RepID=A0ACC6M6Q5_9BACI|nr:hypothetical protein [Gracilibacillus sp. S3-1-1]MDX8046452.1 hypothetical protein [Gracilibacillus sp. S3-1-1]